VVSYNISTLAAKLENKYIDLKKGEMKKPSSNLNLGCGAFKKDGFVNVDIVRETNPDILINLSRYPYPFLNNCFSRIEADHVLEHLEDPFAVMEEMHRILEPNGDLRIRVPHFSRGFTHADHKRGFDTTFFYYFMPKFKGGYSGTDYELKGLKLRWFAQPYFKKTLLSKRVYYSMLRLGKIVDFLANIAPFFCSRFWCYYVGGFEEIEFHFICKK